MKKIAHTCATSARRVAALVLLAGAPVIVAETQENTHIHGQTQAKMNVQARAEFVQTDAELNKTYQAVLKKLPGAETQKLKEAQRAWIASRDAEAARAAKGAEGGSMAPALRYEAMIDLTQKRIKELKAMLDHGADSGAKASKAEPVKEESPSGVETERTSSSTANTVSPDKKWEYKPPTENAAAKIVRAGTNETAGDLSEDCVNNGAAPLWAPDSKRFALSCGNEKVRVVWVYRLLDDRWTALENPLGQGDQIDEQTAHIIEAQAKKEGLHKGTFLHLQWSQVDARSWLDPSTLVLYISMHEVVRRNDGAFVDFGYGANLVFTLRFDDAGNWKIVKTHQVTGKAAESPSRSTPLANEILYRSPEGSYRIQASVDVASLWIVPAKDPNLRKPLPGADPDDRSPEEFRASPDEIWLFDNRQDELYGNAGDFAFSAFNGKQWFWKKAAAYASKEFHFARSDITGSSTGWSSDSARLLINFEASLHPRVAYFNTRTKAFEQTPYLRMVNTKLHTEKPYENFPQVAFSGERLGSYVVFAEPIDPRPSEEILKARLIDLDQELNSLREKELADLATRKDNSIVEFRRSQNDEWNRARDVAMQLYLPFAPDAEKESLKLQFLCDVTQREVNGLKETVPSTASDKPAAQSPSPAASPP